MSKKKIKKKIITIFTAVLLTGSLTNVFAAEEGNVITHHYGEFEEGSNITLSASDNKSSENNDGAINTNNDYSVEDTQGGASGENAEEVQETEEEKQQRLAREQAMANTNAAYTELMKYISSFFNNLINSDSHTAGAKNYDGGNLNINQISIKTPTKEYIRGIEERQAAYEATLTDPNLPEGYDPINTESEGTGDADSPDKEAEDANDIELTDAEIEKLVNGILNYIDENSSSTYCPGGIGYYNNNKLGELFIKLGLDGTVTTYPVNGLLYKFTNSTGIRSDIFTGGMRASSNSSSDTLKLLKSYVSNGLFNYCRIINLRNYHLASVSKTITIDSLDDEKRIWEIYIVKNGVEKLKSTEITYNDKHELTYVADEVGEYHAKCYQAGEYHSTGTAYMSEYDYMVDSNTGNILYYSKKSGPQIDISTDTTEHSTHLFTDEFYFTVTESDLKSNTSTERVK